MSAPFGSYDAVNVSRLRFLAPIEQKQGILMLRQMGLTKRKILQKTRLFSQEYEAALATPPYKIDHEDD